MVSSTRWPCETRSSSSTPSAVCVLGLILILIIKAPVAVSSSIRRSRPTGRFDYGVKSIERSIVLQMIHRNQLNPSNSQSRSDRLKAAILGSRTRLRTLYQRAGLLPEVQDANKIFSGSSSANVSTESPVFPQQYEYIMSLSLGNPAQNFLVIVDTGSDLVWVQCEPCTNCFNETSPLFDPSKSSTYRNLSCSSDACGEFGLSSKSCSSGCEYQFNYGDGSLIAGVMSSETVNLETSVNRRTLQVRDFAFGCGHHNEGRFAGADGLAGLGQGAHSFTSQIGSALAANQFSHCFVSMDANNTKTSPLIFGEAAVPRDSMVKYTPMLQSRVNPSAYYVRLKGIYVEGEKLDISSKLFDLDEQGQGGTILDSGTSLTFLNQTAFDSLVQALERRIDYPRANFPGIGLDLCYNVSDEINDPLFPLIAFQFSGVTYHLPTKASFIELEDGVFCLAMGGIQNLLGFKSFSVIGNIQQQNMQIVYDRGASRIGFWPRQCDEAII